MRPAAETFSLVLAQSEADAQRLRESGAADVAVCGNLKFDMTPDVALLERGRAWHVALGRDVSCSARSRAKAKRRCCLPSGSASPRRARCS